MLVHHRWYLPWSGDTVTLDGETFLDVQLAPHQAEASTLFGQSGIYHEEHETISNSASTINEWKYTANIKVLACSIVCTHNQRSYVVSDSLEDRAPTASLTSAWDPLGHITHNQSVTVYWCLYYLLFRSTAHTTTHQTIS